MNNKDAGACACGSGGARPSCCGPLLDGDEQAQTAEALMRSRYSAFVEGDEAYLAATWHPNTRPASIRLDPARRWLGLKVVATEAGRADDGQGTVEFVARYKVDGGGHRLHERSRFERLAGRWVYVDGDLGATDGGSGKGQRKRRGKA